MQFITTSGITVHSCQTARLAGANLWVDIQIRKPVVAYPGESHHHFGADFHRLEGAAHFTLDRHHVRRTSE